jgi:hypothetical protein
MRTAIFPTLLIALDLGASVVYAVALDWRRALYWQVLTAIRLFVYSSARLRLRWCRRHTQASCRSSVAPPRSRRACGGPVARLAVEIGIKLLWLLVSTMKVFVSYANEDHVTAEIVVVPRPYHFSG